MNCEVFMRRLLLPSLVFSVLVARALPARAQDDVRAVIAKAIKAHGGEDKIDKHKAGQVKTKGTAAGGIEFTEEVSYHLPDKFKTVQQFEVMGKKIILTIGFNGQKAWMNVNGVDTEQFLDKITELIKEEIYAGEVTKMTPLKDKKFELSALGEMKVEGNPALGVRVSSKGHKDVNLYFDKKSGLLVKVEHRTVDLTSGQEVNEEKVFTEYKDADGLKEVKRAILYRDGKKFVEAEVVEIKYLDTIDDSEFNKP
jgi:hypothetical protein